MNDILNNARLSYAEDGAEVFHGGVTPLLGELRSILAHLAHDAAGVRISGLVALQPYVLSNGPIGAIAAKILGLIAGPFGQSFLIRRQRRTGPLRGIKTALFPLSGE